MSQFVKKVLPKADADAYAKAKFSVQAHNSSAKAWWTAIAAVKENEWYLVEFPTFKEWCEKYSAWAPGTIRMALSNARKAKARRLITETTGEVIISSAQPAPTQNQSASQLRGNTTPEENKNGSLAPVVVDALGVPIPPHALPFWHRKGEVEAVMQVIENLRKSFRERVRENDPLWTGLPAQQVEITLHNAFYAVKNFLPYAVCTSCQGHVANGSCDSCHGTGMVSQYHFEKFSDRLSKQIRDVTRKEMRANT